MEDKKEIAVTQENKSVVNFNIQDLLTQAIDKQVPVETMERLLALYEKMKATWAKEQFDRAMAKFQADCPTIQKTKEVKTNTGTVAYKYAPLESIVEQVKTPLQDNGFSYSTSMELLESGVKVALKVTHKDGHSEVTPMEVPLGNKTNVMSQSQVVAAASTFAKRYAFCNAFGILTGDEDNDGQTENLTRKVDASDSKLPAFFPASKVQLITIGKIMKEKGLTVNDVIDAGFVGDATKLTGGREGTASELINYLINAKSKIVNGEPVIEYEAPSNTAKIMEEEGIGKDIN